MYLSYFCVDFNVFELFLCRYQCTHYIDSKDNPKRHAHSHVRPVAVMKSITRQPHHQCHDAPRQRNERPHHTHTRATQQTVKIDLQHKHGEDAFTSYMMSKTLQLLSCVVTYSYIKKISPHLTYEVLLHFKYHSQDPFYENVILLLIAQFVSSAHAQMVL